MSPRARSTRDEATASECQTGAPQTSSVGDAAVAGRPAHRPEATSSVKDGAVDAGRITSTSRPTHGSTARTPHGSTQCSTYVASDYLQSTTTDTSRAAPASAASTNATAQAPRAPLALCAHRLEACASTTWCPVVPNPVHTPRAPSPHPRTRCGSHPPRGRQCEAGPPHEQDHPAHDHDETLADTSRGKRYDGRAAPRGGHRRRRVWWWA